MNFSFFNIDFLDKLFDKLREKEDLNQIKYLETNNILLLNENLTLLNKINFLQTEINSLSTDIIENFWIFFIIILTPFFIFFLLKILFNLYWNEILIKNPLLNYLFSNNLKKEKLFIKDLENSIEKLKIDYFGLENKVKNFKLLLEDNKLLLNKFSTTLNYLKEENIRIIEEYRKNSKNLISHSFEKTNFIYNKNDIKNISNYYVEIINNYNISLNYLVLYSNSILTNFIDYIKLKKEYDICLKKLELKYPAILTINCLSKFTFNDEDEVNNIFNFINNIDFSEKNYIQVCQEILINYKLIEEKESIFLLSNHKYFSTFYIKKYLKEDYMILEDFYVKLCYLLKNIKSNYVLYMDSLKIFRTYNEKLIKNSENIYNTDWMEKKYGKIENISLKLFNSANFKENIVNSENINFQNKEISNYENNTNIEYNDIFNLNTNLETNKTLNLLEKSILEFDFYNDYKVNNFEGLHYLI